jgi:multidrug efflux system membrane fusion protein
MGDIQVRLPALGTIAPLATVTVKTQISGQLQKIAFTEGQLVRAGDFLAQIDPRPYEVTLKQAQANLARDQALLANARLDKKRYEGLVAENSVSKQQLDTQTAQVAQYEGTVAGDTAQVSSAALNLQYTHIVSPITGRVGLRQVDQGNYVTPGDANGIVVVTQLQPITAVFSIPEYNITTIMKRLNSGATLEVEAYDRNNNTRLADGKLLTVDNQIDSTTGTFKLRALFDNKDGLLVANQFVNIRLLVDTLSNQIVMPNAAVHRGAPNGVVSTFVYVANSDNTVTVRPIVLGVVDGERVAVTDGLAQGDVVVTAGGDRLRDGARVMLPTGTSAPAKQDASPQKKRGSWQQGQGGDGKNRRRRPESGAPSDNPAGPPK